MIHMYTGTGGSGKSLNTARRMELALTVQKMNIIANFPINTKLISRNGRRKIADFVYVMNDKLTVPFLIEYAEKHHKAGKESQTLLIIDEAGIMFNPRDYSQYDRKVWINFFMVHRHYGYDVILAVQHDRLIDRQIRAFAEYEVKHRKLNNAGWMGFVLKLLHIPLFVAVEYWYGIKMKTGSEFFLYRKRYSKLYDTMMLFGGKQHGKRIGEEQQEPPREVPDKPPAPVLSEQLAALSSQLDNADLLKPPDGLSWEAPT